MNKMSPLDYFPNNYEESRKTFRFQVDQLEGQLGQLKIPSKIDNDLSVDYAYWPALGVPETLLVLTSGIHGSETYAGAAILNLFMTEILPKVDRQRIGFFLVHAMNPYGFKYHQRTTEAGVNLNRNFSVFGDLYKNPSDESLAFHEKFYESGPVTSLQSKLLRAKQIEAGKVHFDGVTLDEITKAVAPGQFKSEKFVEYGGGKLEPQSKFLIEKMREIMPQYKKIVGLDLHTGLGDKNRLHLLTSGSGHDLHPDLFRQLFDEKADEKIYVHTPATTEGFYTVRGALNSLFSDLATAGQQICSITMEFGTLGHSLESQLEGLNSFILAHQGQYYGFASNELEVEVRRQSFERSYPQTDEWRQAVLNSSRELLKRILLRAGSYSADAS